MKKKAVPERDPATTGVLPRRYLILGVVCVLAIAAAVLWFWYVPNYGGGVDEASYFLSAKGLALHGDPAYRNDDPTLFVPENMVEPQPGVYYPIYPIGYPLLAAAAYKMGGAEAPFMVNPVMTLAALLGAFLLARHFLNDLFACAAMLILGTHSAILYYGVAAWSHASDLAFSTWCLYLAYSWYRGARGWRLVLSGFLLGYAVSIRYTEVLLALPVGWVIVMRLWEARGRGAPAAGRGVRGVLAYTGGAVAASVAGVLPLLWFHEHAFGSIFRTGYSLTGHSGAFSLHWFWEHAGFAFWTLGTPPHGLLVLFPLGIIVLGFRKWVPVKQAVFLGLAAVPTLLIYVAYYWMNRVEPLMYVRFFLTIYPLIVIAALMPVDQLTRRWPWAQYGLMAVLAVYGSVNLGEAPNQAHFAGTAVGDQRASEMVIKHLPRDAVIVPNVYTAYTLVYTTDMKVIYPPYFFKKWVDDRLAPPPGGAPEEFSPIRRQEFAAALGGRTQDELWNLLREKLLAYARQGRTVALLAEKDNVPWFAYLAESFNFVELANDDDFDMKLWRLEPK